MNHPVAATVLKNAAARGTKLIVCDPRRSQLAPFADMYLQMKPDSDVALLNGMMHVIIAEGLADETFIAERTSDFESLRAQAEQCPPEAMSEICGISAEEIRQAARLFGGSRKAMIFWGMGVSQHIHGTDNARCLIALSLLTGNIGRPGCGLHPLRGQNNVQGASDAGLIPMMLPDYQRVESAAREPFEKLWGAKLSDKPGLTVVEILHAAARGDILGMYVMGENPAMSDPDAAHAREGLCCLRHLVVAGYFSDRNRGAGGCDFAGVGVCRKNRHLHQHRPDGATWSARAGYAGRGAAGFVDYSANRTAAGNGVELSGRGFRRSRGV